MPLPYLIEIVPLRAPVHTAVSVPGSKSITNRALILAALAPAETILTGALWSDDTQVMVENLRALGFQIQVAPDRGDVSNRAITVRGLNGLIGHGGAEAQPVELYVGNAGTTARFLAAFVCLGHGFYRLQGTARMHERPQVALFQALRQLGYPVLSPNDRLPVTIQGGGPRPGRCEVSIKESSQFASALLLCAETGRWQVQVADDNAEESPYISMTRQLSVVFPRQGGTFQVEPDASSGSYFLAAAHLVSSSNARPENVVRHWPQSDWQMDARFPRYLPLPAAVSRQRDLGDSIMTAMILAPFAAGSVKFSDLGRLRVQECERVAAMRTELAKCGCRVEESGDALTLYPSSLHGAEIETYQDHRVAMCFAVLGLKVPGIKIRNPACVKKTFPNFYQKLAAFPPEGLGAQIRDAASGYPLLSPVLFAE